MDTNFRDTEMVSVVDSVVKMSLGMECMAIEEVYSMFVNHCATLADNTAATQNWEKELDTNKEAELWQWYMVVTMLAGHMQKPFTSVALKDGRKNSRKVRRHILLEILQLAVFMFSNKVTDEGTEVNSRCKVRQHIVNIVVLLIGKQGWTTDTENSKEQAS